MSRCPQIVAFGLVFLSGLGASGTSSADYLEAQKAALDAIANAADRVCNIIRPAGQSQSLRITGDVKAELNGLIRQLADLGISGAENFNTEKYEGVLREDLAGSLKSSAECKLKVFETLQEKMIASPPAR